MFIFSTALCTTSCFKCIYEVTFCSLQLAFFNRESLVCHPLPQDSLPPQQHHSQYLHLPDCLHCVWEVEILKRRRRRTSSFLYIDFIMGVVSDTMLFVVHLFTARNEWSRLSTFVFSNTFSLLSRWASPLIFLGNTLSMWTQLTI